MWWRLTQLFYCVWWHRCFCCGVFIAAWQRVRRWSRSTSARQSNQPKERRSSLVWRWRSKSSRIFWSRVQNIATEVHDFSVHYCSHSLLCYCWLDNGILASRSQITCKNCSSSYQQLTWMTAELEITKNEIIGNWIGSLVCPQTPAV